VLPHNFYQLLLLKPLLQQHLLLSPRQIQTMFSKKPPFFTIADNHHHSEWLLTSQN